MNANSTSTPASTPVATWIGACFVLLTLTISAAQLEGSSRGTPMASQHAPEATVSVGEFEYFPAQYVNRASEVADHIQAF